MADWPDDPWADDARCPDCGHHAGRGCGCTCCGPQPAEHCCTHPGTGLCMCDCHDRGCECPVPCRMRSVKMFDATQPTMYQRCKTCGLHYRTGQYEQHQHRAVRRGV